MMMEKTENIDNEREITQIEEEAVLAIDKAVFSQNSVEEALNNIDEEIAENPELSPIAEKIKGLRSESQGYTRRLLHYIRSISRVALASGALAIASSDSLQQEKLENIDTRIQKATAEMDAYGIPSEQQKAYKPGISPFLYKNVRPWSYNPGQTISEIPRNIIEGRQPTDDVSEDAWHLYLGMPQTHKSFKVSKYDSPHSAKESICYSLENDLQHFIDLYESSSAEEMIQVRVMLTQKTGHTFSTDNGPLGNFSWFSGKDERGSYIAYYDRWDLGYTTEGESGLLGKPFEIYGRIYYNPSTFEPIQP